MGDHVVERRPSKHKINPAYEGLPMRCANFDHAEQRTSRWLAAWGFGEIDGPHVKLVLGYGACGQILYGGEMVTSWGY